MAVINLDLVCPQFIDYLPHDRIFECNIHLSFSFCWRLHQQSLKTALCLPARNTLCPMSVILNAGNSYLLLLTRVERMIHNQNTKLKDTKASCDNSLGLSLQQIQNTLQILI